MGGVVPGGAAAGPARVTPSPGRLAPASERQAARPGSAGTEAADHALRICLLDATALPPLRGNAAWFRDAGLTEAELHAAGCFRHSMAQACHLGARLLARSSLAARSACSPDAFEFASGAFGKPEVRAPAGALGWHFNLTHGGYLVACATARHPVGIDVEPRCRDIEPMVLAQAHCSREEAAWLRASPRRSRDRFLALWTLKEAYLKGRGIGLSVALSGVRIRPCRGGGFVIQADGAPPWHARLHRVRGHWLALAAPVPGGPAGMVWWDHATAGRRRSTGNGVGAAGRS